MLGAETYRGNYALETVKTGGLLSRCVRRLAAHGCGSYATTAAWCPASSQFGLPTCMLRTPTAVSSPGWLPSLPPLLCAVIDICRAAEEVFDHSNHFEHLASVRGRDVSGGHMGHVGGAPLLVHVPCAQPAGQPAGQPPVSLIAGPLSTSWGWNEDLQSPWSTHCFPNCAHSLQPKQESE